MKLFLTIFPGMEENLDACVVRR